SVEADSEHPLAGAIVAAARQAGPVPPASRFRSLTGRGVEATVNGSTVAVGGPSLLRERSYESPDGLRSSVRKWEERGDTVLYVVKDQRVAGGLALADQVRPESAQAVTELKGLGIDVAMITGDAGEVARSVGHRLGIDAVFAEVLPENKDRAVADL